MAFGAGITSSIVLLAALACACALGQTNGAGKAAPASELDARRLAMVSDQIAAKGIATPGVLDALRRVPRHRFVPLALWPEAYDDRPLPIGSGQTISQPYIVALMTELARPHPGAKILEIGTGSGYQAAVLGQLARAVYSIEIVPELGLAARTLLGELGYTNVQVRIGDGYDGWPEEAPFDAILLTASPPEIPEPLLQQLAVGGRLVAPVGEQSQELVVVTRTSAGFERKSVIPVRFVPMTGKAQDD